MDKKTALIFSMDGKLHNASYINDEDELKIIMNTFYPRFYYYVIINKLPNLLDKVSIKDNKDGTVEARIDDLREVKIKQLELDANNVVSVVTGEVMSTYDKFNETFNVKYF